MNSNFAKTTLTTAAMLPFIFAMQAYAGPDTKSALSDAQPLKLETIQYSNGEAIELFLAPGKAGEFGRTLSGRELSGKALSKYRKQNAVGSDSYVRVSETRGLDCGGCTVITKSRYEDGNLSETVVLEGGIKVRSTVYGDGPTAGMVVEDWTPNMTKTFKYEVNDRGRVKAVTLDTTSLETGATTSSKAVESEDGKWRDASGDFFHSGQLSPKKTQTSSGFTGQPMSQSSSSSTAGCDPTGCWVTGTVSCPSGWSCTNFTVGPINTLQYRYEMGPEVSFLDSIEGSGFDDVIPPSCVVDQVAGSGGALSGGTWYVYGTDGVPARAALHLKMFSTMPGQINSTRIRITMGTHGDANNFGVGPDVVVQPTVYDRTFLYESPVVGENGGSFIKIETEATNVQYPEHVPTVTEPC